MSRVQRQIFSIRSSDKIHFEKMLRVTRFDLRNGRFREHLTLDIARLTRDIEETLSHGCHVLNVQCPTSNALYPLRMRVDIHTICLEETHQR